MSGTLNGNQPRQAGVLTGRQNGVNTSQPQQQGQQNVQQSHLAKLAAVSRNLTNSANQVGGNSGNIYNFSNNVSHNFNSVLGLDDNLAEEQIKQNAIAEASAMADQIATACLRRYAQGLPYKSFLAALERFKRPLKDLPTEQPLVDFVNLILSQQNLFALIVINGSLIFTGRWAQMLSRDDGSLNLRSNQSEISNTIYTSFVDSINFQFLDYLKNNPESTQVYYQFSNILKEQLTKFEANNYEPIAALFAYTGVQCPWAKGCIESITSKSNMGNPLLDVADPLDMGYGGSYTNPNPMFANNGPYSMAGSPVGSMSHAELESTRSYLARQVEMYKEDRVIKEDTCNNDFFKSVTYSEADAGPLSLDKMTAENRLRFNVDQFAVSIPGTDLYVCDPAKLRYALPFMRQTNGDKVEYSEICYIYSGTLVYKFDWVNGYIEFRRIHTPKGPGFELMAILSNPSILLPYMYVEDGLQKTTYDINVIESNKFANDGYILPEKDRKLERQQNVLVGNKSTSFSGENRRLISHLKHVTEFYNKNGELDSMAIPYLLDTNFELNVKSIEEAEVFFRQFAPMVHGASVKHGYQDTGRVIRELYVGYKESNQKEMCNFVRDYLTNLVNRWLIECRGYPEKASDAVGPLPQVIVNNIFTELQELLEFFKDHDPASLNAFLNYKANDFIRTGIEIIVPLEISTQENIENWERENPSFKDDPMHSVAREFQYRSVIIRRASVVIDIITQDGPVALERVVVKESLNPELFAIVHKSVETATKNFKDSPQVLVRFKNSLDNQLWILTPSDLDYRHVITMRPLFSGCSFATPRVLTDELVE